MKRKLLNVFGILWIIGVVFLLQDVYIDMGSTTEQLMLWSTVLFLSLPGIFALLFYPVSEFLKRRSPGFRESDSPSRKDSSATSRFSHQDERWIFLSYRRADSADISGRIYDRLIQQFGRNAVFKDVYSITPGLDFRSVISDAISHSRISVAVIGPNWFGLSGAQYKSRIDDPADFVRIEVSSALKMGIPVIPLLVSGATMPTANKLPDDLKALANKEYSLIRPDPDFDHDMERVISGIRKLIE